MCRKLSRRGNLGRIGRGLRHRNHHRGTSPRQADLLLFGRPAQLRRRLNVGPFFAAAVDFTIGPDYEKVLGAIADAKRRLAQVKRFDMPGFCPNEHYIREMQRYGILPADHDPRVPVDPYATDQAYWRSMWHRAAKR